MNPDIEAPRLWTITTIEQIDEDPPSFCLSTAEGPGILVGIEHPGGWAVVDIRDVFGNRIDRYEGPAAMGILYRAQNAWSKLSTERMIRAALRAYQDAATEATVSFYRDPEPMCDGQLKRASMLDDAAQEIRSALARHIAGEDPMFALNESAAWASPRRREWIVRVVQDIEARLRGESPPLPEMP